MSKYEFTVDLDNWRSTHTKVIKSVGENKTILEVGCASGYMSKVLKEKFGATVYGIELDPEDAERAKGFCKEVVTGNIEELDLAEHFEANQFDVVLFADVLEHLNDPEKAIKKVKPYVKESIVVSIPNISHASIIYELFEGKFDYTDLGLLDCTHKTFFTKESFTELLHKCGFKAVSVDTVFIEPENTEKHTNVSQFPDEVVQYVDSLPESKAYQYVFKAYKTDSSDDIVVAELQDRIAALQEQLETERACAFEDAKSSFTGKIEELQSNLESRDQSLDWYKVKFKEILQQNQELLRR